MLPASFITFRGADEKLQTYVEFAPPASAGGELVPYGVTVVLDCSGSMSGGRMAKANLLLREMVDTPNVEELTLIRFGSHTEQPCPLHAGFTDVEADLGGNDFVAALTVLIAHLSAIANRARRHFVVFVSDGEADSPEELYEPLRQLLAAHDIPLLSVAISHEADPQLMVRLATLHGGGLHLIADSVDAREPAAAQAMLREAMEVTPLGRPVERAELHVFDGDAELSSSTLSYKQGEELLSLSVPAGADPARLRVELTLRDERFALALAELSPATDFERYAQCLAAFAANETRRVVGEFVAKRLAGAAAAGQLRALKQAVREGFEAAVERPDGDRGRQRALGALLKTLALDALTRVNSALVVVEDNDLTRLLELYTGRKVSSKMNARLAVVAGRNRGGAAALGAEEVRAALGEELAAGLPSRLREAFPRAGSAGARPLAQCLLTLSNPFEQPEELSQGEWVGNACLLRSGLSAALDPWTLPSALVLPFKLSNLAAEYVHAAGGAQNLRAMRGYAAEFNAVLPVLDGEEDAASVLLSLRMMAEATPAQQQLSRYFTNSPDLFAPRMLEALYGVAAVKTLAGAEHAFQFGLGVRVLLTLLAHKLRGGGAAAELRKLVDDPLACIGSKEPGALPNVVRAVLPLCCAPEAFALPLPRLRKLFYLLTLRLVAELTSKRIELRELLLTDEGGYRREIAARILAAGGKRIEFFAPEGGEGAARLGRGLDRITTVWGLHVALREYLRRREMSLEELSLLSLDGRLPEDDLTAIGRGASLFSSMSLEQFLTVLVPEQAFRTAENALASKQAPIEGNALEWDEFAGEETPALPAEIAAKLAHAILVVCCRDHVGATPAHSSESIAECLRQAKTIPELLANAEKAKSLFLPKVFGKEAFRVAKLLKKRRRALAWVYRARVTAGRLPLEKMSIRGRKGHLWFSNTGLIFRKQEEITFLLRDWLFLEEDLHILEEMPVAAFEGFDLNHWKNEHRCYLPGFHLEAARIVAECDTFDEFHDKMRAFYAQKASQPLSERKIRVISLFAGQYYRESQADEFSRKNRGVVD